MVATKIITLYSNLWEPLLNPDEMSVTGHELIEFSKKLPLLRKALSCCVCGQLLTNREVLSPSTCREHFVCKACRGMNRDETQKCSKCENWDVFEEDEILNIIVQSYQQFCHHILTCERVVRLLEIKHEVDKSFDSFKLIDMLGEGLKGFKINKSQKRPHKKSADQGIVPIPVPKKIKSKPSKTGNSTSSCDVEPTRGSSNVKEEVIIRDKVSPDLELQRTNMRPPNSSDDRTHLIPTVSTPSSHTFPTRVISSVPISEPLRSQPELESQASTKSRPEEEFILPDISRETTPSSSPCPSTCNSPTKPTVSASNAPLLIKASKLVVVESPSKSTSGVSTSTTPTIRMVTTSGTGGSSLPFSIPHSILSSMIRSNSPHIFQISHPSGVKTLQIAGQQIRLAPNMPLQGRIPVQLISAPVSVSNVPNSNPSQNLTTSTSTVFSSTTSTATTTPTPSKRRVYVPSTMPPLDLPRAQWTDPTRIFQYHAREFAAFSRVQPNTGRPNIVNFNVCRPPTPTTTTTGIRISSTTGSTDPKNVSGTSLVRPTGVTMTGGGILPSSQPQIVTSKAVPSPSQSQPVHSFQVVKNTLNSSNPSSCIPTDQNISQSSSLDGTLGQGSNSPSPLTGGPKKKSEGCRCGSATPNPGKLTCIGQRCACYADRNACSDCKCKGCKNPYVPGSGGKKVLHAVRAFDPSQPIPYLTATSVGSNSTNPTILTSIQGTSSSGNPSFITSIGSSSTFATMQPGSSNMHSSSNIVIPLRISSSGATQFFQITPQSFPIILPQSGNGAHLQTSNPSGFSIQGLPVSIAGLQSAGIPVSHIQQRANVPQPPGNVDERKLTENRN